LDNKNINTYVIKNNGTKILRTTSKQQETILDHFTNKTEDIYHYIVIQSKVHDNMQ